MIKLMIEEKLSETQLDLDLDGGSSKKTRSKEHEYSSMMLKKSVERAAERAKEYTSGDKVKINVRGMTPFSQKKLHFITGVVIRPGTLGLVKVKLDTPFSYRETRRGKRITDRIDSYEFSTSRLTKI